MSQRPVGERIYFLFFLKLVAFIIIILKNTNTEKAITLLLQNIYQV